MKRLGTWLCGLGMAAAATGVQAEISDDEVRLGLITDFTNVYHNVGQGAEIAAEMAIEDFGGEVLGKKIRLLVRDHQLNPEVAMAAAKDLHENHNVDAFVEMVGTNVALPLQKYAAENNIAALHTGTAASVLTGAYCSPVGVHWTYDTYALAAGTAAAIAKQGGDSWYFLTADYVFGKVLQGEASVELQRHGAKVVGSSPMPFKGRDFTAQILAAMQSGAKVVGLANAGDDAVLAIRQAYELGLLGGEQTLAGMLVTEQIPQELGLYAANGVKLTTAYIWNLDEQTRAWDARFRARYGAISSMFYAGVYSAMTHYLKAIEAAGTDEPKAVIAQLRTMPINDFFARNGKLREDGRMVHDMYLVEIKKPSEAKEAGDYYKLLEVIPGDQAFRPIEESDCPLLKKT